jgi:hypothetical protein
MLKNCALLVIIAGVFCFSPVTVKMAGAGIPMDTAQLRALDKVTGRTSTVEVKVGEVAEFGTLLIKVDVCKTNPPEETPENSAFLEIVNVPRKTHKATKIFSGWMFSSSPALSALESPNYDVWVLKCTGDALAVSDKKEGEDAEMHQDKDVMPTVTIQEETAEELEPEVVPVVPESEVLEESFWF